MLKQTNSNFFLIENKLKSLEEIKEVSKYWNISWEQGEFLSDLVLQKTPKSILEIGTSNGFSTLWIAKNISEGSKIYTIEVDENRFNEARKNFNDCKIENIKQIKGEIIELLNSNKLDNIKFDFIFLDAAHKFYIEIIEKLIKKELMTSKVEIVADNIISHHYMNNYVDFMNKKFQENKLIELGSGFLVSSSLK